MRVRFPGSIPFCLLLAAASAARAAPTAPDQRLLQAGRFCEAGDTRAAVLLYSQIYVETLNPLHVYRQAVCYQRNGNDEKAIERYREFLRVSRKLTSKQRERIETRLLQLSEKWLADAAARAQPRPTPVSDAIDESGAPEPASDGSAPASANSIQAPWTDASGTAARPTSPGLIAWPPADPAPARSRVAASAAQASSVPAPPVAAPSQRRLYSLVAATAAGVALGTGATLHLAREDNARQFNRTCYPIRQDGCDQLRSRVGLTQTAAVAGYAGAAVLAALSAYFYVTAPGEPTASRARRLALAACTPTLDGLSCGARF